MALEYQFYVSTGDTESHLLETAYHCGDFFWSQDGTFLDGIGVQVGSLPCSRLRQEVLEEAFGFRFDNEVYFRLGSDPDGRSVGYSNMLTVVLGLLQQEEGQALLLFNGEIILLQRFNGSLVLNLDWQTWQKQGTDKITLPYSMQSLPSPLL